MSGLATVQGTPPLAAIDQDQENNNSSIGNSNNNTQSNSPQNRNNRDNRNIGYMSNHNKDWKGDTNEIGVAVGMKANRLTHHMSVDGLLEN